MEQAGAEAESQQTKSEALEPQQARPEAESWQAQPEASELEPAPLEAEPQQASPEAEPERTGPEAEPERTGPAAELEPRPRRSHAGSRPRPLPRADAKSDAKSEQALPGRLAQRRRGQGERRGALLEGHARQLEGPERRYVRAELGQRTPEWPLRKAILATAAEGEDYPKQRPCAGFFGPRVCGDLD